MSISVQFILRTLAMLLKFLDLQEVNKPALKAKAYWLFISTNSKMESFKVVTAMVYAVEQGLDQIDPSQMFFIIDEAISSLTPEQLAQLTAPIAAESTNSNHDKE